MSGLGAKLILLFALLGAALATSLEAEENSLTADDLTKVEDDDSELELQQYTTELMPAISAEEDAEVYTDGTGFHSMPYSRIALVVTTYKSAYSLNMHFFSRCSFIMKA